MQVKQVKFTCFRATDKKEKGAGVDTGDRQTFPPLLVFVIEPTTYKRVNQQDTAQTKAS